MAGSTTYRVTETATDRTWIVLRANSELHAITKVSRTLPPGAIPLDRAAYDIQRFGTAIDVIPVQEEKQK